MTAVTNSFVGKRRILVTGGAGFLGSHLCAKLSNGGAHVICLDNFSTGSRDNVNALTSRPDFEIVEHDVADAIKLEVDEIYNLACPASPIHYQRDPLRTMTTCVLGAMNMLDLARATGAKIMQASTSEVYGDPTVHPQPESYWGHVNPIGIRSCYDEGKRAAETLFFDHRRLFGTRIKVARIFNTYGPQMHPEDGRVVSNFVVQALRGDDLTIYGDGTQTRSFCYVDDLVEGFIRLMASGDDVTGPINLGNPDEFTINELATLTIEMVGSSSSVVTLPLPSDDPTQRRPDIGRARQQLGWEPRVDLKSGLAKTIDYFRSIT